MNKKRINSQILIFVIMTSGFLVRIFNIGKDSLWIPEAKVVCFSQKAVNGLFNYSDAYRPLYLLLSRTWISFFGTSETSVRFLPVILGVISIFFIYKIGEILWDSRTGIISALILAMSAFHVYFSRQGKGVSALLVCLCLLSFLVMLRILKKNKPMDYATNVFLHIMILLSHPFGIFWLITQNACYFVWGAAKDTKRWLISMITLTVFLIPWYLFIISFNPEQHAANFLKPSLIIFVQILEIFSCGGSRIAGAGEGYSISKVHMIAPWILTVIFILSFLGELFQTQRKKFADCAPEVNRKDIRVKAMLLIWMLLPVILTYLYSILIRPIYWPRYVIYAAPAYYLIIGRFISKIDLKKRVIILLLIAVLSFFALKNVYFPERSGNYRQGIDFLKKNLKPGDTIIISPAEMMAVVWYYLEYDDHKILGCIDDERGLLINGKWETDFIYKGNRVICLQFEQIERFNEKFDFEQFNLNAQKIWFVYAPYWALNSNSEFFDRFLSDRYYLQEERLFAHDYFFIKGYSANRDNVEIYGR
ncbi:MAG: glycosyltransferase family 39 protein [Candidatus Omnitrophota bacterium]